MSMQSITHINVDFYDKKYILVNAKQYDKNSRFLLVTCYNHGEFVSINSLDHSAYIRYKKSDGYGVFNFCEITNDGKVLVELTEQMLASDGISYADLVITNKGSAVVDTETGEIVSIDNASILSTMTFCIDVSETYVTNSDIESAYEFNGLNTVLEKAEAEYTRVIQLAKSYAVGQADGIRENEDFDNAKYYYEQTLNNADNAKASEENALDSSNNAKFYYEMSKNVADGLNSGFIPIGTISFSELATAEKGTGFTYNISDDFITDETFREGAGKSYTSGTNVYYTADGYWDCFGGSASVTATVDEVKSYLNI